MRTFFSLKGVFGTRNLVVMAMMAALGAVLTILFTHYSTPYFRIMSLSFLPGMMVSVLFGPWAGIAFGLVSDTVSYLVKPAGPYFVGYALSEMVANFIYACFLFGRPIRVWRVVAARLLITLLCTFGLNYIWQTMLYGQTAGGYFTSARLLSNLAQFPVYVVLSLLFGRLALQLDRRSRLQRG